MSEGTALKRTLIAAIAALAVLGAACTTESSEADEAEEREFTAFDVCTQFVKDRLKAPSSASFPNFFEDDGEVIVTGTATGEGNQFYRVKSHVDAENTFGAKLRTDFLCSVETADGERFKLTDLEMNE